MNYNQMSRAVPPRNDPVPFELLLVTCPSAVLEGMDRSDHGVFYYQVMSNR